MATAFRCTIGDLFFPWRDQGAPVPDVRNPGTSSVAGPSTLPGTGGLNWRGPGTRRMSGQPPREHAMKALVYHGPGAKAWDDVADPTLQASTDAIVQVDTTPICGTGMHILKGDLPTMVDGRVIAMRRWAPSPRSVAASRAQKSGPRPGLVQIGFEEKG